MNSVFLQLIVCGLGKIDISDWKTNTRLKHCTPDSNIVKWFWKAVESFDEERRARLLQFVTGSSRVPLQGFKALQGRTTSLSRSLFLSLKMLQELEITCTIWTESNNNIMYILVLFYSTNINPTSCWWNTEVCQLRGSNGTLLWLQVLQGPGSSPFIRLMPTPTTCPKPTPGECLTSVYGRSTRKSIPLNLSFTPELILCLQL